MKYSEMEEFRPHLSYDPVKELGDMPEFGVIFKFNADYDHVSWYGLGEAETYADRKHGAKLGIYENMVTDNMARYMVPQECGAKEEVTLGERSQTGKAEECSLRWIKKTAR